MVINFKIKKKTKMLRFYLPRVKVSWKLKLSAQFYPDGVFCFENRASLYFDTAIS